MNGPNDEVTLNSRSKLAATYLELELFKESEQILREDVPRHISLCSEDHPRTLQCRSELARTLALLKRWKEAEQEHEKVLQASTRMGPPSNRPAAIARLGIALAKYKQKDLEGAISMVREFSLHAKEGDIDCDKRLAREAEDILLVIIAAKLGPEGLAEMQEAVSRAESQSKILKGEQSYGR